MVMHRNLTFRLVAIVIGAAPLVSQAQSIDWNQLPEPKHLERVLDTRTFLNRSSEAQAVTGRFVQVGAFKRRDTAFQQAERIRSAGLVANLARQGSWYLVMMPETERNRAEVLAGWAKRSGYKDAFIRRFR